MMAKQLSNVRMHREPQVGDHGLFLFEVLRSGRWYPVEFAVPLQGRLDVSEVEHLAAIVQGETAPEVDDKEAECIGLAEEFDAILHAVIAASTTQIDREDEDPEELMERAAMIFQVRNEHIAQIVSDEYRRRRERILARCRPESIIQPPKPIQADLGVGL